MVLPALTIEFEFRNQRFKDAAKGLGFVGKTLESGMTRMGPVLKRELKNYLDTVASALVTQHSAPWPGGTGVKSLSSRSGKAIASIPASVRVSGTTINTIQGQIGGVSYLRTHEFGATIKAKNAFKNLPGGPYMTIPLPASLSADGTPKKPEGLRGWDKWFVVKSKMGNWVILRREGRELVPLYILKRQVHIPPRLNMRVALEAGLPVFVDRAVEAMLRRALK